MWKIKEGKPLAPKVLLMALASTVHGLRYASETAKIDVVRYDWHGPGFTVVVTAFDMPTEQSC